MFNPYILVAALVFSISLFGAGVRIGYKWEERVHIADVVAAQDRAVTAANERTAAETQRTLAAAKADSDARLRARTARMKGEIDAAKKSRPECSRDAVSLGLLHDAITAANGEAPAAAVLPDSVRPAADASGWLRAGAAKLGVFSDRPVRPVPADAR